jgi:hypothetical protein
MLLFQPSTVEIHGFTDEGIARLFAVFISETVATFPLGRGEAHASGFEILIVITHVVSPCVFHKILNGAASRHPKLRCNALYFWGYQTDSPRFWYTADMKAVFLRFVINLQKALLHRAFSSLGVAVRCGSPWQSDMALSC